MRATPSRNPQACIHEVREYGCFKFVGCILESVALKNLDLLRSCEIKPRRLNFRIYLDYFMKLQTKACPLRNLDHVQNLHKLRTVKYAEMTLFVSITIIPEFRRLDQQ